MVPTDEPSGLFTPRPHPCPDQDSPWAPGQRPAPRAWKSPPPAGCCRAPAVSQAGLGWFLNVLDLKTPLQAQGHTSISEQRSGDPGGSMSPLSHAAHTLRRCDVPTLSLPTHSRLLSCSLPVRKGRGDVAAASSTTHLCLPPRAPVLRGRGILAPRKAEGG